MSDTGETTSDFACPVCGLGVSFAPGEVAQVLTCPHCQNVFIAPAWNGATELPVDDSESADVPVDELNAIRIRQLAMGRRATYRARSYTIIAGVACAVVAVQLVWMIIQQTRSAGWGLQCSGYALFVVLATFGSFYFGSRANQLSRDAVRSSLTEPTQEPQFDRLNDGSQRARNLEDVR